MPFVIGGTIGVPIGTVLLTYAEPTHLRLGVGLLLVAPGTYGLSKPAFKPIRAEVGADGVVGLANGVLCGLTGLTGFIITVWCQMRGWNKDEQRAVSQSVMLAAIIMTAISLTASRSITAETVRLYLLGLPELLADLWAGFQLYRKLDDSASRKVVLLLLTAEFALTVAAGWPIVRD